MSPSRRTNYLLLLLVIGLPICFWAMSSLASAKEDARLKSVSLQLVKAEIADLRDARGTSSLTPSERADLTRRVRTAATSARVSDQLLSIESGQESRDAGGATSHAPVYLRFSAVTLEQLVSFLDDVSAGPEAASVGAIDLSIPQGVDATVKQNAESWTAEVTLSQDVPIEPGPTP